MTTESFHIIIIGHNSEAKCEVANALTQQRNKFNPLKCSRNLHTCKFGTQDTMLGFKTVAVVTPDLTSKEWDDKKETIKKTYQRKVFVYINVDSKDQVNHKCAIDEIKKEFQRTAVFEVKYSSADVPKNVYRFRPEVIFTERIKDMKTVLSDIKATLEAKLYPKKKQTRRVQTADKSQRPVAVLPVLVLTKDDTFLYQNPLTSSDWKNYIKTLTCGRARSNLVRVNIVGNHSAGKTTIFKLLQNKMVQCPDDSFLPSEALDNVTTRRWKSNREIIWETSQIGYETELNTQRMAEAMQNATRNFKQDGDEVINEMTNVSEHLSGSITKEKRSDAPSLQPLPNIVKNETLAPYLKEVKQRVNTNASEFVYVSYWDFPGQSAYHYAHQAFLSNECVFMLVIDLSLDFKRRSADIHKLGNKRVHEISIEECIKFWMFSIKAYAANAKNETAPILIVGTHKDKLRLAADLNSSLDERIGQKFSEIQQILGAANVKCIAIDNTKPDPGDLQAIRDTILELGIGAIDEGIPAQWIELERKVHEEKKKGRRILTFGDLKLLNKNLTIPLAADDKLEAFLAHQHGRGQLIHFSCEELKNIILLYPDDLSTFLNTLMRRPVPGQIKGEGIFSRDGIINQNYINETWVKLSLPEFKDIGTFLTNMLTHLNIIHPFKSRSTENGFILPCLLPCKIEEDNEFGTEEMRVFRVEFYDKAMPSTFFNVLLSRLLKQWQLLERNIGEPEVFYLYVCFYLKLDTVQIEVYWKESCITVRVKNFSKSKTFADIGLVKIVDTFKECIADVFQKHRHIKTRYEIKARCPKHEEEYVSLQTLRMDGEAMCFEKYNTHSVALNEVLDLEKSEREIYPILKEKLTSLDLSRIALELKQEDVTSLASRIRLQNGIGEAADVRIMAKDEPSYQRFLILKKWKNRHHDASISDLLQLLTETNDYNMVRLIECLEAVPTRMKYDISDQILDKIPEDNKDIISAMECVYGLHPFLAFELGLTFGQVEVIRRNNGDLKHITYEILMAWRHENPTTSVPRKLLDTAQYLGINTHHIQESLKIT